MEIEEVASSKSGLYGFKGINEWFAEVHISVLVGSAVDQFHNWTTASKVQYLINVEPIFQ